MTLPGYGAIGTGPHKDGPGEGTRDAGAVRSVSRAGGGWRAGRFATQGRPSPDRAGERLVLPGRITSRPAQCPWHGLCLSIGAGVCRGQALQGRRHEPRACTRTAHDHGWPHGGLHGRPPNRVLASRYPGMAARRAPVRVLAVTTWGRPEATLDGRGRDHPEPQEGGACRRYGSPSRAGRPAQADADGRSRRSPWISATPTSSGPSGCSAERGGLLHPALLTTAC